jgi:hypothetical protein
MFKSSLLFYSVFILMLFFCGCKNNKVDIGKALIGYWELRKQKGALKNVTTFKPGNKFLINFKATRFYFFSPNGQMASMGHYRITRDTFRLNGEVSNRIIFKSEIYPEDPSRFFIDFENNQLIIIEDKIAGTTRYYERVK